LNPDCIQVSTTLPTREAAEQLGAALVAGRLAACAQVHGPISSTYRWEGKVTTASEWYCHLKTTRARLAALEAEIRRRHPYQVPELIALPIVAGGADYLRWIGQAVTAE
jgi:periplasmic divalent cation tolerance protein